MNTDFIKVNKADIRRYGFNVAYLIGVLNEHCRGDGWTKFTVEQAAEYGFTAAKQQRAVEKAVNYGVIESKRDNIDRCRYVRWAKK